MGILVERWQQRNFLIVDNDDHETKANAIYKEIILFLYSSLLVEMKDKIYRNEFIISLDLLVFIQNKTYF